MIYVFVAAEMFGLGLYFFAWYNDMRAGIFKSKKKAIIALIPIPLILVSLIPLFMYLRAKYY